MIHEITRFIEYLEKSDIENDTNIFSEGVKLKEGMYFLLERKDNNLEVVETLKVDKKTERNNLYEKFQQLYSLTEMIKNKSLNSSEKIFIDIGSPFAISISGKGVKKGGVKKSQALEAYIKAAKRYLDEGNGQYIEWFDAFKFFVKNKMFDFLDNLDETKKPKDSFMFYFFMKEPDIKDYTKFYNNYLKAKVFLYDLKNGETHGLSNDLNVGNIDKKPFMRHKSASFETTYKVNGSTALKLYKFFRLQQKNKILPNPMPLFVDEQELTEKAIKFYKNDRKAGHKEIIEHLLEDRERDLQNYYLIFFHNGLKGSRIVDLDFVPVFRYKTDDIPTIRAVFKVTSKKDGELLRDFTINNIFHFQTGILNKIFNNQLITPTINGLWIKYFEDMKVNDYATDTIVDLFYKYRKALYDYVYKSKRQAITSTVFYDMMRSSIMDDIRHDKEHDKTLIIKEKLNIWFSLYNYFNNNKNSVDMINKTEQLFDRLKIIAKPENSAERITTNEEFAFASGQLIRTILNKSEAGERSHAILEPFLQKTNAEQFKLAIAREFEKYKHAFKFYKGDSNRYEFDKIISEVMGIETSVNMKTLLPLILAGYFSETIFKKETENNNEKNQLS